MGVNIYRRFNTLPLLWMEVHLKLNEMLLHKASPLELCFVLVSGQAFKSFYSSARTTLTGRFKLKT